MRSHQRYKLDAERNTADTNRKSSILLKEKILTTRETTIYTTRPDGTTTDREPFFFFLSVVVIVVVMLSIKKLEIVAGQFQSLRVVLSSRPRARYQKIPFLFFFFFHFHFEGLTYNHNQQRILFTTVSFYITREREREKEIGKKYTQEAQQRKSRKKRGENIIKVHHIQTLFVCLVFKLGLNFLPNPSDLFLI